MLAPIRDKNVKLIAASEIWISNLFLFKAFVLYWYSNIKRVSRARVYTLYCRYDDLGVYQTDTIFKEQFTSLNAHNSLYRKQNHEQHPQKAAAV